MPSVKVLIVDDSVVYRSQVRTALERYPWIEITGTASNGRLALERLSHIPADLLILDLEMPELDGLQTLRELSKVGNRSKVLVFSSASRRGADISLEALKLGATDFVAKPGPDVPATTPADRILTALEPKLRALYQEHFQSEDAASAAPISAPSTTKYPPIRWDAFTPKVILLGSSTGGPTALEQIILQLSKPLNIPILIVQHMPPIFTTSLAERLSRLSGLRVKEGDLGEPLVQGTIYIAPGDYHMTIAGTDQAPVIQLDQLPQIHSVRPAVDALFASAAQVFGKHCLGVVLTGMGNDGAAGAQRIKEAGGAVIIQERATCVVYGMPGAVEAVGAHDRIIRLSEIAGALNPYNQIHSHGEKKSA